MEGKWNIWINRKVYVKLIDGKIYTGIIEEATQINKKDYLVTLLDKYSEYVAFLSSEIKFMKEVGNGIK